MSDEIEELYERALELAPSERAAFVADACADNPEMRAELLSLLAASAGAASFFSEFGHAVQSPPVLAAAVEQVMSTSEDSAGTEELRAEPVYFDDGASIGHYRIIGRIGRGGMGTVYRAFDTRLNRDVALKFLSPRLSGDDDVGSRLLSEARAAAALQHPNICVVHEIGATDDGQPFMAMALCEGDSLKRRLANGPVPLPEALSIVKQIASALDAAHSRQIVHGDVKPGNIIVGADGTAKLLDFGLAASSEAGALRTGVTPGTVAYMSPEQVRGETLDHRSDLWSLGVVLYEMLAGRRPFGVSSDIETMRAILHDEPEPLQKASDNIPDHVSGVVSRLLAKPQTERYQSASLLIADLERGMTASARVEREHDTSYPARRSVWAAGAGVSVLAILAAILAIVFWLRNGGESPASMLAAPPGTLEPSIAVLPLTNLSTDSGDAVVAAGITEELITTLAGTGVRVIGSTSTNGFRNTTMDARQIADSLDVSNLLEGSIQSTGPRLRVELRLVSARDGATTWSQTYDREFDDVFAVQDEIARTVAGEVGLRFDKDRQLRRHGTRSVAAYELYLRGSDPVLLRSQAGVWKALEYFQQAIAADSSYAAAYAGLALVQVRRGRTTSDPGMPLRELYALAESSALKAVALDDSLPEAHYALGRVKEVMLEFTDARSALERAVQLDPTRAVYHRSLSYLHGWWGSKEGELVEARRALETDPLNPYSIAAYGGALFANGRYDEALVQLNRVAAMKPPLQGVAFAIAQCHAQQGRLTEAIATLRPQAESGDPSFRGLLGYMLAKGGRRHEADSVLADLTASYDRSGTGAFQVAMVHLGLGHQDQAFAFLDRAIDDRTISSMIMGPFFKELHPDPRFAQLKRRLGV